MLRLVGGYLLFLTVMCVSLRWTETTITLWKSQNRFLYIFANLLKMKNKNEKLKYHIHISIHTLYSVLSWSTFGRDYSFESSWVWTQPALHTWIWGFSAILICRSSQTLSDWMGTINGQPFSGLSRDVWLGSCQGSGWGHSKTFTELSLNHSCFVLAVCFGSLSCWMRTFGASLRSWALSFNKYISVRITLLRSAFPQPWPFPQSLKNTPTAWCCHHYASPVGILLGRWWVLPDMTLRIKRPFRSFFQTPSRLSCVLSLRRGFSV